MTLYHGSSEECFVPRFGLGNDEHDYGRGFYTTAVPELAREKMNKIAYDVALNPIVRTFSSLLAEVK